MSVQNIEELRAALPEYAKDTRLNLSNVLSAEGTPDVTDVQRMGIALSCAYAMQNAAVVAAILGAAGDVLGEKEQTAAKLAASLMAMNNVYYRFTHLVEDPEIGNLPAKLRMNGISNPGIPKVDFELASLAISALSGCGLCMKSHAHHLKEQGVPVAGIQAAVRIAAVVAAAAQTMTQEAMR